MIERHHLNSGNIDWEQVKSAIRNKLIDVNATYSNGNTLLHLATAGGKSDIVELLIARGADSNTQNNQEQTAFTLAVREKNLDILKQLIRAGVDPDAQNIDTEALLASSNEKDKEIAKHLSDAKAAKARMDEIMKQPFDLKAKDWNEIEEFIKNGLISVNFVKSIKPSDSSKYNNYTLLCLAIFHENLNMVNFLIKCGVNLSSESPTGTAILNYVNAKVNEAEHEREKERGEQVYKAMVDIRKALREAIEA
jgi:ankyrin repeat protein